MSTETEIDYLKLFEFYGVDFKSNPGGGDNFAADCPFTDKAGKLYVNKKTGQWDSKTAPEHNGNFFTWMEHFYNLCASRTEAGDLKLLSENRKLPVAAFGGEIVKSVLTTEYLIPTRNYEGKIVGLSKYNLSLKKLFRTPKHKTSILGIEKMPKTNTGTIYLCEGEWDYFALRWLHEKKGIKSTVLAIPGAGAFKEDWVSLFVARDVAVCYDNDDAGKRGEEKISNYLGSKCFRLRYIKWSDELPDGFDVRDLITGSFAEPLRPTKEELQLAHEKLESCLVDRPLSQRLHDDKPRTGGAENLPEEDIQPISYTELEDTYKKWLILKNCDAIASMFATCFANRLQGDPVWIMYVGPPGDGKSEMIMTLNRNYTIETVSTLTHAALICGLRSPTGEDHSLLKKLDGRMLVIKDLTGILTGNPLARDEIFGTLREAYDGYVERVFAFGKKSYYTHFGIIAGVTPVIESLSGGFSSLGERFIKHRFSGEAKILEHEEQDRIQRVFDNIDQESSMRLELQKVATRMLNRPMPEILPDFNNDETTGVIKNLAMFVAKMRGSVPIDKFSNVQTSKPITEIGTRLAKQFMKLAIGLAIYYEDTVIGEKELRIIRLLAKDTCPDRITDIIEALYKEENQNTDHKIDVLWFMEKTNLSQPTVSRITQELLALALIKRTSGMDRLKTFYCLEPAFKELLKRTRIFDPEPKRAGFKLKRAG